MQWPSLVYRRTWSYGNRFFSPTGYYVDALLYQGWETLVYDFMMDAESVN